jgi:Transcriptional regulatory protein, C terminal
MDARQTLRAHISNLRRKIEPADNKRLIHTDHRVGYRLVDVHPEGAGRGRPAVEVIDRGLVAVPFPRYTTQRQPLGQGKRPAAP